MPSISRRIHSKLTSDGFAARMRRVRIPSDAFDAMKVALKAIQTSTDACLPLKSGVSVALVLLEMSEKIKSNKSQSARRKLCRIFGDRQRISMLNSAEVERSVADIETLFRKIEAFFNELDKEKIWQRLARQDRHKSQIEEYGRLLEETISSFGVQYHPPIQHILFTCAANWGRREEARRCA
ncbi:hypothetical protein C8R45DRAFT_1016342, partial [Mycena sanguinolenta]